MNLIKSCHGNDSVYMNPGLSPKKHAASITRQISNSYRMYAEEEDDSLSRCACGYLGVESLGILGNSVELWETEHVLLAARPVKNSQSEGRQRGKNLPETHAAVRTITTKAHLLQTAL